MIIYSHPSAKPKILLSCARRVQFIHPAQLSSRPSGSVVGITARMHTCDRRVSRVRPIGRILGLIVSGFRLLTFDSILVFLAAIHLVLIISIDTYLRHVYCFYAALSPRTS